MFISSRAFSNLLSGWLRGDSLVNLIQSNVVSETFFCENHFARFSLVQHPCPFIQLGNWCHLVTFRNPRPPIPRRPSRPIAPMLVWSSSRLSTPSQATWLNLFALKSNSPNWASLARPSPALLRVSSLVLVLLALVLARGRTISLGSSATWVCSTFLDSSLQRLQYTQPFTPLHGVQRNHQCHPIGSTTSPLCHCDRRLCWPSSGSTPRPNRPTKDFLPEGQSGDQDHPWKFRKPTNILFSMFEPCLHACTDDVRPFSPFCDIFVMCFIFSSTPFCRTGMEFGQIAWDWLVIVSFWTCQNPISCLQLTFVCP